MPLAQSRRLAVLFACDVDPQLVPNIIARLKEQSGA